jgi:hypothetical protein
MGLPQQLPQIITAVGGLGTAAFGLLDAAKSAFPWINKIGFSHLRDVISSLTPNEVVAGRPGGVSPLNTLPQPGILKTVQANWMNGTDLASQKAIAKSLVKLHLGVENASLLADATNVDPVLLTQVAKSIVSGTPLTQPQSDAYSRFDLIVTALLDEAYQHSDQVYRNMTRVLAGVIAVGVALVGGWSLYVVPASGASYLGSQDMLQAFLVGLLATPLAPIAKDLSSALSTAVNTLQAVKK